jgi:Family of unknown function (DUF6567)
MKHLTSLSKWPACIAASAVLLCLAVGCSSTGSFKGQTTGTDVSLNQKNYRVIKPGAMGKSYGFRLLGIVPFANPTYATAKVHLYESVGEPLTGRAVALANQTEDRSSIYLILFSIPKLTVTADVIEFTDQPAAN